MRQTAREWLIVAAAAAVLVACEQPAETQRFSTTQSAPAAAIASGCTDVACG